MSELYQLPDGWWLRELKTVCTFINGRAYKQAELLANGKYPVLRVGNFFTNNSWYYSDLELPKDKYCEQGDLLYAWSASFGPKIWDGVKSIFHYHIWKVEPDYSIITKQYLYWLLFWDVNQIKADFGSGTTMIHITKGAIESRIVPLPPLAEQKMIVQKLDALFERIDKAIALLQKNIDAADNFMNSVLNDVFSDLEQKYESVELTKYVNFIGGSQPPKSEFVDKKLDGYVRLIQIRDYKSDNNIVYVKKTSVRRFCNKDDVMIGRYGPPVFQILRGLDGAYNVALMKAEPNDEFIDKDFLFLFLQNPSIQSYIIGLSQRSAGQSGVNKEALEKYLIAIPPIGKQKETVLYLNKMSAQIEQVKSAQQQKMQKLLDLKSSILDQAFHGKL